MEKSIQKFAVFLLLLCIVFPSCKKGNVLPLNVSHGVITEDFGYCAACGGYFVKFDSDTSVIYRTFQDLSNFGVTASSQFPLRATIGWKPDTNRQLTHFIKIISLRIDH